MSIKVKQFKGIPASSGKFYGKTVKIIAKNHIIIQNYIGLEEVEPEINKFINSVKSTKEDLESIINKKVHELNHDLIAILEAQLTMLVDEEFNNQVIKRIKKFRENAPLALMNVINFITNQLSTLEDEYLRERAVDIQDIGKRLENNLLGETGDGKIFSNLNEQVIIIAHQLTPSQIINMDKSNIGGIATEMGGRTGHMAILAKYYEIPTVVGLKNICDNIKEDEYILLDADDGIIIKKPKLHQIKYYGAAKPIKDFLYDTRSAITKDGFRIKLFANIESQNDCQSLLRLGVDGIGLFRSESIITNLNNTNPSEEEQFEIYKQILSEMNNLPVIIRTFDLGADKLNPNLHEDNPFLGNRGIRYCLQNVDWFKVQIKALLRASYFGNLYIMIPMVTQKHEIMETKKIIEECKMELKSKGEYYDLNLRFGSMIETPSSVICLDQLAKESDFFSIGTNDLLQYTMVVDRNNPYIPDLYNPLHLSFLRSLSTIVKQSEEHRIPVSICGELASDINFTILLIGLGFRELSVAKPLVRKIKTIIRAIDINQAQKLVKHVFKLSEAEKYQQIMSYLFNKHLV
ncbi:MAG: phosphoenolpyruvate--protein phosphotransferase [Leptospiraceae bacterium]|nr:phosphoenolpyruvate--protein phosphotransferase [Leptospiraceae bacterium]MCP5494286.1 phosphoenolpyruvate--protein phosphotransferase [Leptospiraceae bacterium]